MRLSISAAGIVIAAALLGAQSAEKRVPSVDAGAPGGDEARPEAIIQKFAANESVVKEALTHYSFRQTVKALELTPNGTPQGGQWNVVEDMSMVDGYWRARPVYAPTMTMRHVIVTVEDIRDFSQPPQLLLTAEEIGSYRITYKGREQVDELGTYRFDVVPKKIAAGNLYFQGTVWVEDRDLQIVKTSGKVTGRVQRGNEFPMFETLCEQIDGNWFPTYRHADDVLHFPNGGTQRIRITVKYENYKRAQ